MKKTTTRREDYLKLIHVLSKTQDVHGADLARELEVSRPTVSIYLKQLVEAGDITMDRCRAIHLTEQGLKIAESTRDRHGVVFELLNGLGVPKTIAAEDACAIEHNLSPESYAALKQLLQERKDAK